MNTHRIIFALFVALFGAAAVLSPAGNANAAIHEMVAAYCSGGGVGTIDGDGNLEPPGVTGGSNADNFAQPALSSGVVVVPALVIGDSPAAKYPAGTSVFALGAPDHPSASHCKALNP